MCTLRPIDSTDARGRRGSEFQKPLSEDVSRRREVLSVVLGDVKVLGEGTDRGMCQSFSSLTLSFISQPRSKAFSTFYMLIYYTYGRSMHQKPKSMLLACPSSRSRPPSPRSSTACAFPLHRRPPSPLALRIQPISLTNFFNTSPRE